MKQTVKKFASFMRTESLVRHLKKHNIEATTERPAWTNKRLPPPKIAVVVDASDLFEAIRLSEQNDW